MAPVTAVISLLAILVYCCLDFFVRCRKECSSFGGGVSAGVAAGFGVGVSLLLFQGMWAYFMVGRICDYWVKIFAMDGYAESHGFESIQIRGDQNAIWATGGFALISCVLTAIDALVLAKGTHGAPTAPSDPAPPSPVELSAGAGAPANGLVTGWAPSPTKQSSRGTGAGINPFLGGLV